MKYGAHVFLWQDRFDTDDLCRILDEASQLGLDFVEVPIGDDVDFDASRIRKHSEDCELEIFLSPGGEWPNECDLSLADPAHRKQGLLWHQTGIDLCVATGATVYAGALYGHPGSILRRAACSAEHARVCEGLAQLAEYAAERNVRLYVEPMSHFRTHIANTPGQINAIIDTVDRQNLFSLLDTYHLTTEVLDLGAAFEEMLPHLALVHACENNRGAPGTGLLPWDALLGAMLRHGWEGYIGLEGYNSSWRDGEFAFERGMFHNVCPDAAAFIFQSLDFLKERLAALAENLKT